LDYKTIENTYFLFDISQIFKHHSYSACCLINVGVKMNIILGILSNMASTPFVIFFLLNVCLSGWLVVMGKISEIALSKAN